MDNNTSELCTKVIAGKSAGPHLLVLGGVHGDEFESMAAIRRLIRRLEPSALRGKITFVPVANESAYWQGTRSGADGLDMARICPGRSDGSITEQAAHAVSELIQQADTLIDLHSGGLVMRMGPVVGYTLHPERSILDTQRRMARAFNLPLIWGTTATLDGRTLSVARDHNVPAIYAEWLGAAQCDPVGVEAYVEGCLNVMGELGMIDRPPPPSRVEKTVEDDRPDSGHIQLNYPAPFAGFFEPAVRLGQSVAPAQPLGTVSDHLGDHTEKILSTHTGLVLCLRSYNRVQQGDSLAAILEDPSI